MKRLLLSMVGSSLLFSFNSSAEDWPQWRGPNRDGISLEKGLLKEWPESGPPLEWRINGLGSGFSSVAVADGRIYTLGDLEDGSYAIALNESNGKPAWKTRIGEKGGHKGYPGTRSTPTVAGDVVVVLNQHSDLVCLDAKSGKVQWSKNLEKDFGGRMMSGWRYSESPLVDGEQVLATPGGRNGTVVALDRKSGRTLWQTGDWTDNAGYSSVIIATIHGVRQYVQLTGESVAGLDPKTGDVLWKAPRKGKTAVVTTPVVEGDMVFVTSAYGVGCNGFRIKLSGSKWFSDEVYANTAIANHHGGVIGMKGHIYGATGGTFRCLEIKSGNQPWNERSVGKGATVYADGRFYLRSENGPVALIEASPAGYREISRFAQPDRARAKAWAHPVVANGRLYLRDQDNLFAYNIKAR